MSEPMMSSIASVQLAIRQRQLSVSEALAWQRKAFNAGARQYACVIDTFASDAAPASGALQGIALAHKDVFATAGRSASQGRPANQDHAESAPWQQRAPVLTALDQHGAAHVGALAMAEFACGATAENPHSPELLNPLDAQAAVGGSSSGSAVAVTSGMCFASLGTDTAGSVRIPAATCGVVGLKLTQGLIDAQGVSALAPTLDTVGVIGRSASDAAHLYAALLPVDAVTARKLQIGGELDRALAATRRWRISSALMQPDLSEPVAHHLAAFETALANRNALRLTPLLHLDEMGRLAQALLHAEAAVTHASVLRNALASTAPVTQSILLPGCAIPAAWYRYALLARAELRAEFVACHLSDADILLTPSLPQGVPDKCTVTTTSSMFNARAMVALHRYHAFVNYLGLPAIVFPIGVDERGRPVCVQAIAPMNAEETLLCFAHQFAAPQAALL